MKKIKILLLCAVLLGFSLGLTLDSWAIPNLQIYIPGATYDMESETWIINSYDYQLWVIGAHINVYDVKFAMAVPTDEDGSIDVTWLEPGSPDYGAGDDTLTLLDPDLGGDPLDYDSYRDSYETGTPDPNTYGFAENSTPLMGDGDPLPPHGVFPTDFYEYYIGNFGTGQTVENYIPGPEEGDTAPGEIKKFDISVSGYSWVDIVAYDHVVIGKNKAKYIFSPFSHDGAGGDPVPEPATMLLLGSGFIGLAGFRKRLKSS